MPNAPNMLSLAGPNSKYMRPGATPASFLAGVWHGLICPISFLISVVDPDVRIYETKNDGRIYDVGFLLGASVVLGGGVSRTPYLAG